ncbi:MAG TPA: hypothetical protein ENI62_13845 [Gammaproteobacteria bacterium]|nr:hypothetical protein [Gammaproteobacteria bacterium]
MATAARSTKLWGLAFVVALIAAISGWGMFWSSTRQADQINTKLTTEQNLLQSVRDEVAKNQSTQASLTTENARLKKRITTLEGEKSRSQQQLTAFAAEKIKLAKHVVTITGQLTQVQEQLTTVADQLTRASTQKQQLEKRLDTLTNKLKGSTGSLQALSSERDQVLASKNDLQQRNSALQDQVQKLLQEQKALRQQAELSKQQNAELTANIAQYKRNIEQLSKRLASSRAELMANTSQSTLDAKQLSKQLANSVATINRLQNKRKLASTRLQALQQENQDLKETRDLAQELQSRVAQLRTERARFKASLAQVKIRLRETLRSSNVKISQMKNNTTAIRLGSDITFALASAELTSKGKVALDLIAQALNAFPSRLISIEGHTDPLPLSHSKFNRYPSNWELSAARSASAVRYLISRKVDPKRLRVVGYSAYRPLTTKVEEYARNRRIVILLLPATSEQIISKKIPVQP